MARLNTMLRKTEFHLFLFFLFFLLFNWPLLTLLEKTPTATGFVYLFAVWSALVALLAVIARQVRPESGDAADSDAPRP